MKYLILFYIRFASKRLLHIKLSKIINKGGQNLFDLIDNLLDLSKVESSDFAIHCEKIPIHEFIDDLKTKIHLIAFEKNISLYHSN
ncbi:hypothetical protein Metev_0949 [Methanohalobium evestigatum Z-7303]|uniref:Uncharacterized protein n=1 Tax=Methanohalobium evestigatum (strain ATCC BAA-1072 / DSM 3721 / NBRC 107634 / OCM 161 / Z-7303) TaxID=644295 RepID=D7E794_METEZ|nr:hypothetical protein [Methanohalobium evestigatum]ADI73843.1 hypothetical protein Metev_0949 [Methanohalobium evestigatum Z-7303]